MATVTLPFPLTAGIPGKSLASAGGRYQQSGHPH